MNQLSFDPHQFAARRAMPCSAETELAFTDYMNAMHTDQRKLAPGRTNSAPHWAYNESAFRELLVRYLEARAFMNRTQPHETGTQRERLERACAKLRERVPEKIETLRGICQRYVALKNSDAPDREQLARLETEIKNLDRDIRTTARLAETIVGVSFYYFRCGLTSVETAERLHLSSPGVRQILYRLARTWQRMNA
jgi:hypothetical protein